MKKQIAKRLSAIILATMFLTLILNYFLLVNNARENMVRSSHIKINQIEEILKQNSEELETLKESLKEDYIIRASAAAYVIQNHPEVISDQKEMEKIARLLQVDELHVFDRSGRIYAGSEPKYFGYTFHSGEQMEFFLPMLKDRSLKLVQDITPNTAEGKLMQYTAVWQEDGKNIIQIGMAPVRLLKAMEKNELTYIFSMVTSEEGTILLTADENSRIISGSTSQELNGVSLEEVGVHLPENLSGGEGFQADVNGVTCYCVFEPYEGQLLGVITRESTLYQDIPESMFSVGLYLILAAVVMIITILIQVDRLVIRGTDEIIKKLTEITEGNLDTTVAVDTSPEFIKLSRNINQMVKSQLNAIEKLSRIFDTADVQIGVFEYSEKMRRVLATKKVAPLLMLSGEEARALLADREIFKEKLEEIYSHPVKTYKEVYRLSEDTDCFLRILTFSDGDSLTGIITDVTEAVREKRQLEHDRDYDLLTGLLNRRGFILRMEELFAKPEDLKEAVLLMVDMDHLKYINDNFGHANGDLAIQKTAGLLKECTAPNRISARLSGDEFVLFLYGEERERLESYIEELHGRMLKASMSFWGQESVDIRMSGGYIFYSDCHTGYGRMLRMADQAMYQAKNRRESEFVRWVKDTEEET